MDERVTPAEPPPNPPRGRGRAGEGAGFTPPELLIAVIARLLEGCRHVAVGSQSPIPGSAALLARELSRGGSGSNGRSSGREPMRVSVLGSRRHNFFTSGGVELFDLAAQG